MQWALITNSVVCLVGVIGGALFAGGSIISIANMTVPWTGALIVAALLLPVMFAVSGVGAWVAHSYAAARLEVGLFALPWVYGAAFVAAMLVSFKA